MKKPCYIRIISVVMCLITAMGVLSACSSKKDADTVNDAKSNSFIDPQWIIGPTIDAESIEPLVRADYNESTRHYDISYADCFKIKKSGKYGIIDYNGKIVVSPEYDSIVAIRNSKDFLAVKKDKNGEKSQTYINYKDFSKEPAYRTYNSLRYEYLWVSAENSAVFIQNDGGDIYEDDFKAAVPETVMGVKDVNGRFESDGTYGLYINGRNVMGMIYSGAGLFANGMAAFKSNGVWGYVDSNCKTVIPFGYDAVKGYSAFGGEDTPYECYDGYVTVTKNGKFAILTNEGKSVTDIIYDGATPVVGGRAYLLKDGKWGLVSFGDSTYATARTDVASTAPAKTRKAETTTEKTTVEETTTEADRTGNYIVNTEGLNLRTDAGTENDIITELSEGTELTVDRVYNGWGHVYYDGNEGWVLLDYLDKE